MPIAKENSYLSPLGLLPEDLQNVFVASRMHDALAGSRAQQHMARSFTETLNASDEGSAGSVFEHTVKTCAYAGAGLATLPHFLLDVPFGKGYAKAPVQHPRKHDDADTIKKLQAAIDARSFEEEGIVGSAVLTIAPFWHAFGYVAGAIVGAGLGGVGALLHMAVAPAAPEKNPGNVFQTTVEACAAIGYQGALACSLALHAGLEMVRTGTGIMKTVSFVVGGAAGALVGVAFGALTAGTIAITNAASLPQNIDPSSSDDIDEDEGVDVFEDAPLAPEDLAKAPDTAGAATEGAPQPALSEVQKGKRRANDEDAVDVEAEKEQEGTDHGEPAVTASGIVMPSVNKGGAAISPRGTSEHEKSATSVPKLAVSSQHTNPVSALTELPEGETDTKADLVGEPLPQQVF